VRDDQPAVVEDQMRDESVAEVAHRPAEIRRFPLQLSERLTKTVGDPHLPSVERADQLVLVVAGDGQGVACPDHAHHQTKHARGVRAAVDQVAEEHRRPAFRMPGVDGSPVGVSLDPIPQLAQQTLKLPSAAVHVADHVERTVQVAEIVQQRLAYHRSALDLVYGAEHVHGAKAFTGKAAQPAAQLVALASYDVRAEVALGPARVARDTGLRREVEDDGDGQDVVLLRE
jgi:hypothetical protein